LDIQRDMLAEIRPSAGVFGSLQIEGFEGIPIVSCLGDQQSSLVGHLCFQPGTAKNTLGTGAFMLYNTGDKPIQSHSGLITSVGYQFDNEVHYVLEGSIAAAGSVIT